MVSVHPMLRGNLLDVVQPDSQLGLVMYQGMFRVCLELYQSQVLCREERVVDMFQKVYLELQPDNLPLDQYQEPLEHLKSKMLVILSLQ